MLIVFFDKSKISKVFTLIINFFSFCFNLNSININYLNDSFKNYSFKLKFRMNIVNYFYLSNYHDFFMINLYFATYVNLKINL